MKWLLRWLAFSLCAMAFAVAAGTLIPRPLVGGLVASERNEPSRTLLLLSNPIHTDIAFPADAETLGKFGFITDVGLPLDTNDIEWIIVGWGGRSFYIETPTWADLKPGPVFKAFTLDSSVMHVQLAGSIDFGHEAVTPLSVSTDRYDAMLKRALKGFSYGPDGSPVQVIGAAYGSHDVFYEAEGWFNALVGCNTWTAATLRDGGFQTGLWNPLPFLLDWSMQLHNQCDDEGCRSASSHP